jgi:hypothetical protein
MIENLLWTCNQCKREILLVPPSRVYSLHYFLECLVGLPVQSYNEALIFVLCSVIQAPDKCLKHWEPCFFGMKKVNDTWLFWAQESVVIWAIQCIPGQYQGAQWAPTDSWGKTPVIPSLSAGTSCILLHIHLNKVLEASVARIEWFGYLCEQLNTTSCHALYW